MSKSKKRQKAQKPSNIFQVLDGHTKRIQRSLFDRIRGYFLAGIVVTAPIGITIYLTYVFLSFVDENVTKLFPAHFYPETTIPGIGVFVAFIGFIVVGWFATNFLGKLLIRMSEYFVHKMPVIRTLYGAIKQIFETIMASQSQAFREVVMLEYPRKGVWSIGFVTGVSEGEVQNTTENETINVFVPTTPNPTSGYLLFVPKKELKYLNMTVEEGVKLVVSAGIITPPDRTNKPPVVDSKNRTSDAPIGAEKKTVTKVDKKPVSKAKAPAKKSAVKKTSAATKKASTKKNSTNQKTALKKTTSKKAAPKKAAAKKSSTVKVIKPDAMPLNKKANKKAGK